MGVIIDGTGHKFSSVKEKKKLMDLGYDTYMVFVNTSFRSLKKRNEERPSKLRILKLLKIVGEMFKVICFFQGLFGGNNFLIVDNNKFLSEKDKEEI